MNHSLERRGCQGSVVAILSPERLHGAPVERFRRPLQSETGAEGIAIGRIARVAASAAMGGFLFGFDTAVINGAVDAIRDWSHAAPWLLGFSVAGALLGSAIGAWFALSPAKAHAAQDAKLNAQREKLLGEVVALERKRRKKPLSDADEARLQRVTAELERVIAELDRGAVA